GVRGVRENKVKTRFCAACGRRWVSKINARVNEYKALLELARDFRADPRALSWLYFKAAPASGSAPVSASGGPAAGGAQTASVSSGPVIPLDALAHATQVIGPQTVSHFGQLPAVTISFGLAPGASPATVLSSVQRVVATTLPEGVSGQFQGAA